VLPFCPQAQSQLICLGVPHSSQNLPLLPVCPQAVQFHASGLGAPQFMQNFPVFPVSPHSQLQVLSVGATVSVGL
jgi:hypothetical protein